jgi:hypothetical protein
MDALRQQCLFPTQGFASRLVWADGNQTNFCMKILVFLAQGYKRCERSSPYTFPAEPFKGFNYCTPHYVNRKLKMQSKSKQGAFLKKGVVSFHLLTKQGLNFANSQLIRHLNCIGSTLIAIQGSSRGKIHGWAAKGRKFFSTHRAYCCFE